MALMLTRSDIHRIIAADGGQVLDTLIDRMADGYVEMAQGRLLEHPRVYLRFPRRVCGARRACSRCPRCCPTWASWARA